MGIEESYHVPPPCTTAACVPPQGPNVAYERAYDQYGRPIIVVHQQPPPRTQMVYPNQMSYNTNHIPPMQNGYPAHMQTYQPPPPYPMHPTNPYATVSAAQYPGQYAQPSPGTLLTSPGYYYMPATTHLASAPSVAHVAPTSTAPLNTSVQPVMYPTAAVPHSTSVVPLPLLSPGVSNADLSNTDAHRVSNNNLPESRVNTAAEHVAVVESNKQDYVTLPGLTPFVSNTDLSNTDLSNNASQRASSIDTINARVPEQCANDTVTAVAPLDPEPLVSFANVTVTPASSLLPGLETKLGNESAAKNSESTALPSEAKNSIDSPTRVKKSFNPLPRRQPSVKAYLAHEEL